MTSNSLLLLGVSSIGPWSNLTPSISKFTSAANGPPMIGSMPALTGTLQLMAPCLIPLPIGMLMKLFPHLLLLLQRSSLPPQHGPPCSLHKVCKSVFSPNLPWLWLKGETEPPFASLTTMTEPTSASLTTASHSTTTNHCSCGGSTSACDHCHTATTRCRRQGSAAS